MLSNKDKGTSVGFTEPEILNKKEIEKEGEEVAAALGYNIHSLSWDVLNVKTAYCIGRAKSQKELSLSDAIKVLLEELKKDKTEGSYFYSWQANISMAFWDEFIHRHEGVITQRQLSEVSNAAAKRFLNTLIT